MQNPNMRCEFCSTHTAQKKVEGEHRQSLHSVIESIAKIEESIAEILSAESQKVQRVLQCTNSCADIIRINDSVNKTISNVTQLEQVLCSKMNMAREFYNEL